MPLPISGTALILAYQEPPRDALAEHPTTILVFTAVTAALTVLGGVLLAKRSRDPQILPLFLWLLLSGATLFPLVVEPFADWFVHVWYPTNNPIVATVFGRPMPWFAIGFYITFIAPLTVLVYQLARRSGPTKVLAALATICVLEVPAEMIGNQLNWMIYYANPATVFGVPIYCLPQNGGFLIAEVWVLAVLLPKTHGWRWILIPFAAAVTLPVFAWLTTWPAYLALLFGASNAVIWCAAVASTILNVVFVVWLAYTPQLKRLRESSQSEEPANAPARLPQNSPSPA